MSIIYFYKMDDALVDIFYTFANFAVLIPNIASFIHSFPLDRGAVSSKLKSHFTYTHKNKTE